MPQLQFKSIKKDDICAISTKLIDELQKVLECPRDYFTLEIINNSYIFDGKEVNSYPIIEVKWFDRGQEVQDKIAKIITKNLKEIGYNSVDIFFTILKENNYYENGEHF
ncbi:DUF1904 domain-containing protein [Clostridium fallax]|uniref:DUF1904 domain-containing protein n=1 Tax=Clostridium fallax TaxID=1533 RepID=A0A1M4T6N7_9CLOT|nr:DUF1904 domain-containing protein [Clostridium fallax]SHE40024.1 protein of unknown function [Clostridium fallax]SQB22619.1 Domain of uncharacterised function (DUF1904) [Clostridium fallax]